MVPITIVTEAYKPTYNWGASHCMNVKYIHSLGGQAKDDAEKTLSLANLTEVGSRVIRCR